MKKRLSRRTFLKGLFATAGAVLVLGPQALDPMHGASDLTPRERDVVADVLGLRGRLWQIDKPWSAGRGIIATDTYGTFEKVTADKPRTITIPTFAGHWPDGSMRFGQIEVDVGDGNGWQPLGACDIPILTAAAYERLRPRFSWPETEFNVKGKWAAEGDPIAALLEGAI